MRSSLVILVLAASLAGCGTAAQPNAGPLAARGAISALDAAPIFALPGVQVGVPMKLSGQFKSFDINGTGQLDALDAVHMTMSATVTGKILFISETKKVTMTIQKSQDTTWPYSINAVNLTDNKTYAHQAKLQSLSADGNTSTFALDNGNTSVVAADGRGNFKVAYGDFNLVVGNAPAMLLAGPRLRNRPTHEHFLGR